MTEPNPINYKKIQDELKKMFGGTGFLDKETLAEAADGLATALKERAIIQYDIVTGYYRIAAEPGGSFNECSEKDAQSFFNIVIVPLIRIILTLLTDGGHRARKLSNSEAKDLWDVVKKTNTVDSRREEYDAIPAWDGKPRLETFMRDYFDSDSMPILFKLLMTCIMAKWRSPTCHVKYFFDLVGDARGCLAGDTKINVYTKDGHSYKQHKIRIGRLFDLAETGSHRYVVRSFNEHTKEMGYSEAEVIYSGEKQCYLLTNEEGASIECSGNHRFYTDDGWKNILDLKPGDEIYMNAKGPTNRREANYRSPCADAKEFCVKYHPVINIDKKKNLYRLREYKAIWEANANNMSVPEYLDLLNNYDGRPLITIPKGYDVHHINGDHFDNRIENLKILSKTQHGRLHGKLAPRKLYLGRKVKIKSIVPTSVKKTYDLTCVVGEHTYVANEFITHNTGKTTLFEHLLGKRALIVPVASRPEDMFVTAYSNGALVVIDDECSWVNQKKMGHMTYDQFKSMVTTQRDVFSRKFGQPEVHERAFVIVRTSNEPRTSFAANERRQIILNVGLPERVCKHWSMPEEDKQQLLAEAKDYVEKHDGQPYQLTPEEEDAITEANLNNFDTESEWYESIMRFLRAIQNKPSETTVYQTPKGNGKIYVRYINYVDWCKDQHIKYVDDSRTFSRQLFAIAKIQPRLVKYDRAKIKFPTIGTTRAAEVLRKQEEDDESLCESPF